MPTVRVKFDPEKEEFNFPEATFATSEVDCANCGRRISYIILSRDQLVSCPNCGRPLRLPGDPNASPHQP